jgi:acyl-CoA thioesterase FadM
MTYQRELTLGDPYVITAQLLAYNSTSLHQFNRMYQADEHFLAATADSTPKRDIQHGTRTP